MKFGDFLSLQDLALTDAVTQCGLDMGPVGKTYFLLRGAQVTEPQLFDIRLRVDGDLPRYDDIRNLMSRMYGDPEEASQQTLRGMTDASRYYGSGNTYWNDGNDDALYDTWYDGSYSSWYGDDGVWSDDAWHQDPWSEDHWRQGEWQTDQSWDPSTQDSADQNAKPDE